MIGVVGSLFLAMGAFGLTPDTMAYLAEVRYWFNGAQINGLAAQKANAVCGVSLILLAFLMNLARLAFVDEKARCFDSKSMGFVMAFAIAVILGIGFLPINYGIRGYHRSQIGIAIAGRYLDKEILPGRKVNSFAIEELRGRSKELLGLDPAEYADDEVFFKRFVQLAGKELPADFDFSQLHVKTETGSASH